MCFIVVVLWTIHVGCLCKLWSFRAGYCCVYMYVLTTPIGGEAPPPLAGVKARAERKLKATESRKVSVCV